MLTMLGEGARECKIPFFRARWKRTARRVLSEGPRGRETPFFRARWERTARCVLDEIRRESETPFFRAMWERRAQWVLGEVRRESETHFFLPAGSAELSFDDKAGIIHDLLLNVNDDCRRVIIIKLVSNSEIRQSIEEVLHSVPIERATFNKSPINWKDCTQPYAVDLRAFRNHSTRGSNNGRPRHQNPKVCTSSERSAISRAKKKVMQTISSVGTLEQQRLILLKVLTDPSIRDLSSSIG